MEEPEKTISNDVENVEKEGEDQSRYVAPAERVKMFEFYWNKGQLRSYRAVAQEYNRTLTTINNIAQVEGWQARVESLKEKGNEQMDKKMLEEWGLSKKERMQIAKATAMLYLRQLQGKIVRDKNGEIVYEVERYRDDSGQWLTRLRLDPNTQLPIPLVEQKDITPGDFARMWQIIKTELDEASEISTARVDFNTLKQKLNLQDDDFESDKLGATAERIVRALLAGGEDNSGGA